MARAMARPFISMRPILAIPQRERFNISTSERLGWVRRADWEHSHDTLAEPLCRYRLRHSSQGGCNSRRIVLPHISRYLFWRQPRAFVVHNGSQCNYVIRVVKRQLLAVVDQRYRPLYKWRDIRARANYLGVVAHTHICCRTREASSTSPFPRASLLLMYTPAPAINKATRNLKPMT